MSESDTASSPTEEGKPRYIYELPRRYQSPKHWQRGNKAKSGAPSRGHIFIGVGHALSNWEHVEASATMLFGLFSDSPSIASQRAFGTIIGARAREAALREAADTFFTLRKNLNKKNREMAEEIKRAEKCMNILIHNYGQASGRRNDIAHGIAWELSFKEPIGQSWFLIAPNHQSRRTINWIEDDMRLRAAKGLRLADPKAYFDYNKFYYKNADYVFGMKEIKILAGKFAWLHVEILAIAHMMNPIMFKITPERLHQLAKFLSE